MEGESELLQMISVEVGDEEWMVDIIGPLPIGYIGMVRLGETEVNYEVSGPRSVRITQIPVLGEEETLLLANFGEEVGIGQLSGLVGSEHEAESHNCAITIYRAQTNVHVGLNPSMRKIGDKFGTGKISF